MNEPNKLIPAYLQATNVIVGFCMYAIPASDLQSGRRKDCLKNRYQIFKRKEKKQRKKKSTSDHQ